MNTIYGIHGKFIWHVSYWMYYPDNYFDTPVAVTDWKQAIKLFFTGAE
jgi:hypothetical protein